MHGQLAVSTSSANIPPKQIGQLTPLFVALQVIGGQIGLPIFIGVMLFSKKVKRHLMLVNFCGSWIIYSIVYCLTIYNNRRNDNGAGKGLCVAQAVMVHGVVPLSVTAYCALHLQVWMGLRAPLNENAWLQQHRRTLLIIMLFAPYVVFVGFCTASLVVILEHPETLQKDDPSYYCTLNFDPLVFAVPGYAAGIIVVMLTLEVVIGVTLFRRWAVLRQFDAVNHSSLSVIIRIAVFSIYGFATLGACAAFLARSLTAWPYLIQASLPTAIFCAFGTRQDVWMALCFWKREQWTQTESRSSRGTTNSSRPIEIQIPPHGDDGHPQPETNQAFCWPEKADEPLPSDMEVGMKRTTSNIQPEQQGPS